MSEAQAEGMGQTPEMLAIYRDVLGYAQERGVDSTVVGLIKAGLGFSDNYKLYVRETGNILPVDMSTMYAPSLKMAGLDLTRLVDNAEESRVPEPAVAKEHKAMVSYGWYVGSRLVIPTEEDVIGFVGRNKHGVETVLKTTPQNIVHATQAALARGIVAR
jgi:hypothetical protein